MQYQLSDFDYNLPEKLIAKYPLKNRTDSRLLHLKDSKISHYNFSNILNLLRPNDLLIFNDTRVIPARLFGQKETGGKVEVLIERILSESRALCHIKANRSLAISQKIIIDNKKLEVIDKKDGLFIIKCENTNIIDIINNYGHMPLPPYIDRQDEELDQERYQTVYNKNDGAVAAPTAGLHFDDNLMQKLKELNIETAFITLHVGAGTFKPVNVDNIKDHKMHSEFIEVSEDIASKIKQAKKDGRRIVAIGTTTLRSLETAGRSGVCEKFVGDTDIFIYPGFKFNVVDCLVTNFHLPKSTLLMLVSAFAGYENIKQSYSEAIKNKYRFFSYGDAMFLER